MPPLRDRARGRWAGILAGLGLSQSYLTGKHGPCPICGGGKDRFRFDDKDGAGTWICSRCRAGDGFQLVMLMQGWDFARTAAEVEKLIGSAPYCEPKQARPEAELRNAKNAVWRRSVPVQPGDPVGRHLWGRCGLTSFPGCLRTATKLLYRDEPPSWHPAMVAMVTDRDGKPVNLHRTYLTTDGRKAAVEEPRRMMPGTVPKGSAIRLCSHEGVLGVAEGIETAFSASALFSVPCWATISTSIMAKWEPPDEVQEVVIFGDNDANFAGHAAAYELAHRLSKASRPVRVMFPADAGQDWNDVWQSQRQQEQRAA